MTDEEINNLPKWVIVLCGVLMTTLFLWVGIHTYQRQAAFTKEVRYTIGYITKTGYVIGPSSHSSISYEYAVDGQEYQAGATGDVPDGCTRCLVKFAVQDPEMRQFYNRICIPDDTPPPPPEGWQEPPFFVRAGALD